MWMVINNRFQVKMNRGDVFQSTFTWLIQQVPENLLEGKQGRAS